MMSAALPWKYGENQVQKYYDMYIGKDYLCVIMNKAQQGHWMGMYKKNGRGMVTIGDKQYNERNKDEGKSRILTSDDPEYIKKKLWHCYQNGEIDVTV